MTFTKKKLAALISGSVLMTVAANGAFAALDLDKVNDATVGNEDVLTFASELNIGTAGLDLTDGTGGISAIQDLQGLLNANATPANTDVRVTVTLSNGATFANAPSMDDIDDTSTAAQSFAIFSGGLDSSTVVFNGNAGTGFAVNEVFDINVNGVNVLNQSATNVSLTIQLADNFGPVDLVGFTDAPFITFANSYAFVADAANADGDAIDVTQNSLFFATVTGDSSMNVGGGLIKFTANLDADSVAMVVTDAIANGNVQRSVIAANGFAAFTGGTVSIGTANAVVSTADTTLATSAVSNPTNETAGTQDVTLVVGTANTVAIAETTLVTSIAATASGVAYNATSINGATVPLQSLVRNGSSARLSFALTPGGAYPMFVRVTNPAAISGPVTLTLTNDDGDTSSSIALSAIDGVSSDELAAGASTGLMDIDAIFAAVQAADATFDLGVTNKLRVDAVADFGDSAATTGVIMSAFSLSTDGTTFNMLTSASD